MKKIEYVITNEIGLHARPAGLLAKVAKSLDSAVTVEKLGGKSASASRMIALMGLGAKCGDTLVITVEGGNEEANAAIVEDFLKENL